MVKQEADSAPASPVDEGSPSEKTFPEPTAQEAYFFFNVIKNLKTKPDVDWDSVAEASGLKNGSTASVSCQSPTSPTRPFHCAPMTEVVNC